MLVQVQSLKNRRHLFCYLLTRRRGLRIVRDGVFLFKANAVSHSLRRSSLPRKAGGFAGTSNISCISLAAYFFAKAAGARTPLLLLSAKSHSARLFGCKRFHDGSLPPTNFLRVNPSLFYKNVAASLISLSAACVC